MTEPSTARNRQGRTRTSKWVTADEVDVKIEKLAESRSWKVALALDLPFDEREDIQQDLHFALWKRLRRFDPSRGALTTFLFRVANNEASKIIGNRIAARRDY